MANEKQGIVPETAHWAEWQSAKAQLIPLQERETALDKQISALGTAPQSGRSGGEIARAAAAMLRGGAAVEETNRQLWQERYDTLIYQRVVVRAAIELQRREVGRLHDVVSGEVCAAVKPSFAKLVNRLVEAAREMAFAQHDLRAFADDLREQDIYVESYLPTPDSGSLWLGDESDRNSRMFRITDDAKRYGYLGQQ